MLPSVAITALALALGVRAQDCSTRGLRGTWSTGSNAVQTGPGFCSPADMSFTYPNNTGISYSFTDDLFYEEAQYRYDSNATNPNCIRGKIMWQHGTYVENSDGSLNLSPFSSDGRIQVQDPCAAQTNVVTYYNTPVTLKNWAITTDQLTGRCTLNLNAHDGAKMPPMYLVYDPPNMMPTRVLTGTNETGQTVAKRDTEGLQKGSGGAAALSAGRVGAAAAALAAAALYIS